MMDSILKKEVAADDERFWNTLTHRQTIEVYRYRLICVKESIDKIAYKVARYLEE